MKHGFELVRESEIPETNTLARIFHHVKTGAELLSMENDDENKVFGVVFRTPPPDSTGLPHIMEHSVLSGSLKYPVKDPFIELSKGSLNTFLNAMTSPDKTSYPVASQNVKDLYNLIDVYLDAVFYPRIAPHTLQQEGWHYELESPDDPLTFKGVVFNEMKGAYSSPDNLMYRHSLRALFPDTPYGLDSGGDPAAIPDLTYDQFKSFHETYYHPSNARIYFYGDDDPEERLRVLNEWLKDFGRIEVASSIPLQPPFDEPRSITVPYDAGEDAGEAGTEAKKGMLTVNWLLTENSDPETTLALIVLNHILIGTPASPLRKALIDSGLGEDLAGWGLNDSVRQMYFSAGLKGIAVQDADKVEALIAETLSALSSEGIEHEMIEASLNTIEFQLRENNTGRFPRGLALMFRSMSTWLYGGDPLAPLAFEAPLQAIKGHLAAGERYFESLIHRYLVENTHQASVLLKPDPNARQEQEAVEQERLAQTKAAMREDDLHHVIESARELKKLQETPDPPEALATIPTLTLNDLDRENKLIPLEVTQTGTSTTLYHDLFTNGIVYLDLAFDIHTLPQDLLPYVPLFGQALVKMGTETEDFVRLSQRIGRKTGGISPLMFTSAVVGAAEASVRLVLRGKATVAQANDLLAILQDILRTVKLDDQERFKQLVLEAKAGQEAGLVPGGHRIVNSRVRAQFDEAGWTSEQTGGVEQLLFVRQLAEAVETDWPAVLAKLEAVRSTLINSNGLVCNVTLDRDNWTKFEPKLAGFVAALPTAPAGVAEWKPVPPPTFEGLTIPARVNYVGKGANLYKLGYELDGSIMVIGNLLRSGYLWERIRIQGGAYGAYFIFDRHSGVLTYLSYRDPNLLGTVENYDGTSQFLRDLDLSQDELVKSIIGAIGRMDDYQLPDAKGYTSMVRYLIGESDEVRQCLRDEVLGTTVANLTAFADVLRHVSEHGRVVVMGSQEAIDEANAERGGWLKVTKVL